MLLISVSSGDIESGFRLTFDTSAYTKALGQFAPQFVNSLTYGSIATVTCFLIGFPVAYTIAFRGGRYKNLILFMVIAPFFTSFLIRTLSWKILLGDNGPLLSVVKSLGIVSPDFSVLPSAFAVVAGLTYNFLPFMILPLYAALETPRPASSSRPARPLCRQLGCLSPHHLAAGPARDLAGTLLTFIPALGDYVNADLLGTTTTRMIGNVIQSQFFLIGNYQIPAALSFVLMAAILVAVFIYARVLGTEELTG